MTDEATNSDIPRDIWFLPALVHFAKVNRRWVAYIYADPVTAVSQQVVGSRANVDVIIRTQLEPKGIPFTIESEVRDDR